jgi:hypothetical protein
MRQKLIKSTASRGTPMKCSNISKATRICNIYVKGELYTVAPVYNDIGLYDTSYITSGILLYQLIPRC